MNFKIKMEDEPLVLLIVALIFMILMAVLGFLLG